MFNSVLFQRSVSLFNRCHSIFVVTILLSGFHVFADSSICQINPITSGPVSGRAGTVTLPDGRTVTVVGHIHGETKSILDLQMLVNDVDDSNQKFLEEMNKRLKAVNSTIEHFKEDNQYLLSRLESNDVQFVALEAGDELLKTINERTFIMWVDGKQNLDRRGLDQPELFQNALLAYGGAARYVKIMHPEYRETYKFVGAEDDRLMQESLDSIDQSVNQLNILLDRLPKIHPFRQVLNDLFVKAVYNYQEMLKYPDDQIISGAQNIAPPELRIQVPVYMRAILKTVRLLRERDQQTTSKLLAHEGSTIYFVGLAHLGSQLQLLGDACRQQMLSPAAAAGTTR